MDSFDMKPIAAPDATTIGTNAGNQQTTCSHMTSINCPVESQKTSNQKENLTAIMRREGELQVFLYTGVATSDDTAGRLSLSSICKYLFACFCSM